MDVECCPLPLLMQYQAGYATDKIALHSILKMVVMNEY